MIKAQILGVAIGVAGVIAVGQALAVAAPVLII